MASARQQTTLRNRVILAGSGDILVRSQARHVTFVGGHGLPLVARLSNDVPVGEIVQFRRRNDYAGQPFSIATAAGVEVTKLLPHAYARLVRVKRTATGWEVLP